MDIISYNKAVEAMEKAQEAYEQAKNLIDNDILRAEGIYTTSTNLYLQTNSWVRVTDEKGYNNGNPNYMPIIASQFSTPSGEPYIMLSHRFDGGREIVDMSADETVEHDVNFNTNFHDTPIVVATFATSVPEKMQPLAVKNVTKSGFTIYAQRNNNTATFVNWIAINTP